MDDEMREYIEELEISETKLSPSAVYASPNPPERFPMIPWVIIFDNTSDVEHPTKYSYKIIITRIEHFIPNQYGEFYHVETINMEVRSSLKSSTTEKIEFAGSVNVGIDYVINNEIVIRFKELGLDSFHSDGYCDTYFYIGVL
ncbi:MAG: hypothetical protein ACXQS8_06780 [Candidatus Helarchaeales archaeon]